MRYLSPIISAFRKFILIGWALAVVWIYIGNLVNFHQHRIWGKQLIPVAAYTTRAKEKDGLISSKSETDSRILLPGLHFDFSTPFLQVSDLQHIEIFSLHLYQPQFPLIQQDFEALSFRGPPSA